MTSDVTQSESSSAQQLERALMEVKKVVVGQDRMVERMLVALLSRGHCLLEGVPGVAKSLAVETLATVVGGSSVRLQFTPDLLPADLVGTMIYNQQAASFSVRKGPVFANVVLADEINRAPAKVQSALLEAMAERQVTIGDQTFPLPSPFLVLATQNPIEQEGTYPLPEAQVDRFMLKVRVGYPTREEEKVIMDRMSGGKPPQAQKVIALEHLVRARELVTQIYMDEKVKDYILNVVFATREPGRYGLKDQADYIQFGASPRATISLSQAARAHAFLRHRGFVTPEDVKAVAFDVLRHRISLTYEAEAEELTTEKLIQRVFDRVEVP